VSFEVYVRPEAEKDLKNAAEWYERRSDGLGDKFLDEVQIVFETLLEHPEIYPLVHRNTHRAVMNRFPFGIFYRIKEETIVVLTVMHGSRHPRRWQFRA
jgi:plasmid stabilization system protein ParE